MGVGLGPSLLSELGQKAESNKEKPGSAQHGENAGTYYLLIEWHR